MRGMGPFTWQDAARRAGFALAEEGGQALVELALTWILFSVLLVGGAEFARLVYASIEVSNAAKAAVAYGARSVATAADATGMKTAASDEAANVTLDPTTVSTSYTCSDGSTPTGTTCSTGALETILTVNTQATVDPIFHVPGLPTSYTITGQAVQKVMQ